MKVARSIELEEWLARQPAKNQALIESRIFRLERYDHFGDAKHLGPDFANCAGRTACACISLGQATAAFCCCMAEERVIKRATSKKQKFSLNDTPIRKTKRGARVKAVSSSKRLRDQDLIFRALWECLVEQDIESFKDVLRAHLDVVNKQRLSKKAKTSRRTLHRILSPEGNPTLKSISKVISALYG